MSLVFFSRSESASHHGLGRSGPLLSDALHLGPNPSCGNVSDEDFTQILLKIRFDRMFGKEVVRKSVPGRHNKSISLRS